MRGRGRIAVLGRTGHCVVNIAGPLGLWRGQTIGGGGGLRPPLYIIALKQ